MVHTLTVLAMMWDGGVADVFNSPYVVPVFGTVMVLGIVVANVWSGVRTREMRSQERLAAIAKGLPLPPSFEEQAIEHVHEAAAEISLERQRNTSRRAGLVLLFVGLGLVAFFVVLAAVLQVRPVLSGAAAALIPAGIGVGFLVDARARTRDLEAHRDSAPDLVRGSIRS